MAWFRNTAEYPITIRLDPVWGKWAPGPGEVFEVPDQVAYCLHTRGYPVEQLGAAPVPPAPPEDAPSKPRRQKWRSPPQSE